jgi:hypothetical protein
MWEALVIILALGGLEIVLWWIGHEEVKKQTELLEEIAVSLSLRETNEPAEHNPVTVREQETTQAH